MLSLPEAKSPTTHIIGSTAYTARGYDDSLTGDAPEMTYKGTSLVMELNSYFGDSVDDGGLAGNGKAMYGRLRRPLGYSIYVDFFEKILFVAKFFFNIIKIFKISCIGEAVYIYYFAIKVFIS